MQDLPEGELTVRSSLSEHSSNLRRGATIQIITTLSRALLSSYAPVLSFSPFALYSVANEPTNSLTSRFILSLSSQDYGYKHYCSLRSGQLERATAFNNREEPPCC